MAYKILVALSDPVIFLSLFGPILVGFTVEFLRGHQAYMTLSNGQSVASGLLNSPQLPGLVDYIVQFYTALIVWVFWLYKNVIQFIIPALNHHPNFKSCQSCSFYAIFCLIVFAFGLYVLFLGGAASSKTLSIYIRHTPEFGTLRLPPLESLITWLRLALIAVGIHWLLLPKHKTY